MSLDVLCIYIVYKKPTPLYKKHSLKDILALHGQTVIRAFGKCVALTKSRQNDDQQK